MKNYRLKPTVISVTCGKRQLKDKKEIYPETMWPAGQAQELCSRGFLIEVEENILVTQVEDPEKGNKLESHDLPEDSPLTELEDVEFSDLQPSDLPTQEDKKSKGKNRK